MSGRGDGYGLHGFIDPAPALRQLELMAVDTPNEAQLRDGDDEQNKSTAPVSAGYVLSLMTGWSRTVCSRMTQPHVRWTVQRAELVAQALGMHPAQLWPDEYSRWDEMIEEMRDERQSRARPGADLPATG